MWQTLLIFCFDDLYFGVSGVLKCLTIIMLLSISPFMSVSVCLEVLPHLVHRYLQLLWLPFRLILGSLGNFLPCCLQYSIRSILSDIRVVTPSFFFFPFAWNNFPSSHFQSICALRSEVGFL